MTSSTASPSPAPAGGSKSRRASPAPKPKQPTLKQLQQAAQRTRWEDHLLRDIRAMRLPEPQRQVKWHPLRDYVADFLFLRERLIVEVDGGVFLPQGHHSSGKGYEYDRVRDAEAMCLGYTVMRVTPGMVKDGTAVNYLERVLHAMWTRNKSERSA